MAEETSLYYNELSESLSKAHDIIEAGAMDRRRAAHCPVVATINADGAPSQRVMILREVDWTARTLRFHTDSRSTKVEEADGALTSVLFYDPDDKVQLRLGGTGRVHIDEVADAAWDSSTLFARRCYMAETAPGAVVQEPVSGLPVWIEGRQPTADEISPVRGNFAVLLVHFDSVEWLYLANSGHRRARWLWDDSAQDWLGSWLVP
jgi:pyridoxamine 5'-phosphate oxidase